MEGAQRVRTIQIRGAAGKRRICDLDAQAVAVAHGAVRVTSLMEAMMGSGASRHLIAPPRYMRYDKTRSTRCCMRYCKT